MTAVVVVVAAALMIDFLPLNKLTFALLVDNNPFFADLIAAFIAPVSTLMDPLNDSILTTDSLSSLSTTTYVLTVTGQAPTMAYTQYIDVCSNALTRFQTLELRISLSLRNYRKL